MRPATFMLIAGEASGDMLAADLVRSIREEWGRRPAVYTPETQPLRASLEPRFFGAGGPHMAAAGVDLCLELTQHSVIGFSDVLRHYFKLRRFFYQLLTLARQRQPDTIICVDYSGFNRRFAHAVKNHTRARQDWFHNWNPKIVQFVSPQVWASREGRAYKMARDFDLVLSIFPFEKDWYARKVPSLKVEFVGNPLLDRHAFPASETRTARNSRLMLLLPGSRTAELSRHLPVMIEALGLIRKEVPALRARMVLPNEALATLARSHSLPAELELRVGGLGESLREAEIALASTGTVTMECAFFGVPTVALYKTSWTTFQIGKRIVKVKFLAMPNLLANEEVFPEFIQDDATPQNLARAGCALLKDPSRQEMIRTRLREIIKSLGGPGASRRAAQAVTALTTA